MTREELVEALRSIAVETGSIACLGCGYEHSCSIHGCAVLNAAAVEIGLPEAENVALREQPSGGKAATVGRAEPVRKDPAEPRKQCLSRLEGGPRLEASRRNAMTPQQAAKILRSANLGGVLRTAADLGAEALERLEGNNGQID